MHFQLGLLIPTGQNQGLCHRTTLLNPVEIQLESTFLVVCSQQIHILHLIRIVPLLWFLLKLVWGFFCVIFLFYFSWPRPDVNLHMNDMICVLSWVLGILTHQMELN